MSEQYLRDAGTPIDPCWVPCVKGDPGAERFVSADTVAELREALRTARFHLTFIEGETTDNTMSLYAKAAAQQIDTALNKSR